MLFFSSNEDLIKLSELGHFLKGSSATLGLNRIRDGCENIQRYGKQETQTGEPIDDPEKCLVLIAETLTQVKKDFDFAQKVLRDHYSEKAIA
jgi:osomolarity two-component system phosphorelay intermediate protein YPD1